MDLIKWSDYFDLNDTTPIDNAIRKMDTIKSAYSSVVQEAVKDNRLLSNQYDAFASEAQKVLTTLQSLKGGLDDTKKATIESAKAAEALASQAAKNLKSQEDNAKAIGEITKATNTLADAKKKLADVAKTEAGSVDDMKAKLKEATTALNAMGEATDKAIKAEQIKKVQDLNEAIKATTESYKKAKDEVKAAEGSYDQLNQKNIQNIKTLKGMADGAKGTSAEFKKLQKEIATDTEHLKKWDAQIGVSTRHVGGYKEQIEKLLPGLKKLNPELVEMGEAAAGTGKKFAAFFATPWGLALLAIAGALAVAVKSVQMFTEKTVEGSDKANEAMANWNAQGAALKSTMKDLGKAIFDAFVPMDGKRGFMDDLVFALEAALLGMQKAVEIQVKAEILRIKMIELAKLENEIRKEEIVLTIENAKLQLESDQKLFDSRDKLYKTAQQRYEATIKQGEISNKMTAQQLESIDNQIEAAKKLSKLKEGESAADLIRAAQSGKDKDAELRFNMSNYEVLEKIAGLEAKRYQIQSNSLAGNKSRQKIEIQLVEEALELRIKAEKTLIESFKNLDKAFIESRKMLAKETIGWQKYTLEEQLDASKDFYAASIEEEMANNAAQLNAAKEVALDRVVLSAETNKKIFEESGQNLKLRSELLLKAKEDELKNDQAYINEVVAIEQEGGNKRNALMRQSTDSAGKIIEDRYAYFLTIERQGAKELMEQELTNLNKRFLNSKMSTNSYDIQKYNIAKAQGDKDIALQLEIYDQELSDLEYYYVTAGGDTKQYEDQITKIQAAQSALRLAQSERDAALQIEAARRVKDAVIALRQEAVDSVLAIGDAQFQAEQEQLQYRIDQMQTQMDLEVALAGDNKDAKAAIEVEYNKKIIDAQRQLKESQRKQAIFDKALAVTSIGINTAMAVISALAPPPIGLGPILGIPLAVTVGAIGALQLAVALSKPIPAFAEGVDSAPGGAAIINEEGPELIAKNGKAKLYDTDGPTLVNIDKGSKVFTAKETEDILGSNVFANDTMKSYQRNSKDIPVINFIELNPEGMREIRNEIRELQYIIKNKKEYHLGDVEERIRRKNNWMNHLSKYYP